MSDMTNRFGEMPEDALSAYLDGELTPDARAAVEARLDASPEWRAILADVRVARDAVRQLPTAAPPEGFWERRACRGRWCRRGARRRGASDDVVVDLDAARARRDGRRSRWVAALGSAAAAAVVAAVIITPSTERVKPAVATLSERARGALLDVAGPGRLPRVGRQGHGVPAMRRAAGLGLVQLTLLASLGGAVLLFPVPRAGANDNAEALLAQAQPPRRHTTSSVSCASSGGRPRVRTYPTSRSAATRVWSRSGSGRTWWWARASTAGPARTAPARSGTTRGPTSCPTRAASGT